MARRGHGEGSIYQRRDGRWTGFIPLEGGKRKFFYGKTRRDVQQQLRQALVDQHQGTLVTGPRQTVAEYLKRWLEDTVKHSVRPRTFESYSLNVRRLEPHIGKLTLSSLSPEAVQKTYGALLEAGLAPRSVEQAHTVLHRAMRLAVQWRLIGRNPTEAVTVPRPKHDEMHTLTHEQVQMLFVSSVDDRFHALWVLLATTGLRMGEATGLRWEDVDLQHRRLLVRRALQRQRGVGLVMVEPKSERSRRTVHLASGTVTALREHRHRQLEERLQAGPLWSDQDLVFCNLMGTPVDPARINEALHRALKRAGLPRIRVHDLRHTAATLLLGRGVHPKMVADLLGHSTIVLTLNTYSHVIPALHAEVAAHMDTLFTDTEPKRSSQGLRESN